MVQKNERVALETKIVKYRALARDAPDKLTSERIATLVAELEQKRREIDETILNVSMQRERDERP
jgi:hypothetical protein